MREYKLLLPITNNEGNTLCHDGLLAYTLDQFGGYTLGPVQEGAWQSNVGRVYHDRTQPLYVATVEAKAIKLAEYIANAYEQECVYLRHPSGAVSFVYPATVETPCERI